MPLKIFSSKIFRGKRERMLTEMNASTHSLEQLVGPLNDVEKKFAPKKLYVAGQLPIPLPSPRVAVIGSRKASPQGLYAASNITKTLTQHKVVVVSGLAEGIDTMAHKVAIEEGGHTIAVLGTPLDQVYPRRNLQLQEIIMRHHLVISQFPIGYPVQPKNFVIRNRTMALISNASIIVEAGDGSGSLHQGWEALRLGRPLFICSTIMHDPSLKWPKKMEMYGAMELRDPEEVLELIPCRERILEVVSGEMNLSQLEFGALLTYAPRGDSQEIKDSRDVMYALKQDRFVGAPPILMSEYLSKIMKQKMDALPFASFFQPNTILVPVPKSSLMQPNTLWVPERIATALVKAGIGNEVASCLIRAKPVPKSALCTPSERPIAAQHYESMSVQKSLSKPNEILLVDDVVTRGATLLGAANRLADAFPQSHIRAFAAMRTISNPNQFKKVYDPCIGTIDLTEYGDSFRTP